MLWVIGVMSKQELVSLGTSKMTARVVIPESGLAPRPVETRLSCHQIMARNTSKPLATY